MEREAIVLLENHDNVLPLSTSLSSVALIGPQVDRVSVSVPFLPPLVHYSDPFARLCSVRRLRLLQRFEQWHLPSRRLHPVSSQHLRQN